MTYRERLLLALLVLTAINALANAKTATDLRRTAADLVPVAHAQVRVGELVAEIAESMADGAPTCKDTTDER